MLALITATISCMERACVASILYAGKIFLTIHVSEVITYNCIQRVKIRFFGERKTSEAAILLTTISDPAAR
jgi:hypothetical protein